MKYRMIHDLLKCEIRILVGIIFCSLLSLENGMAQNQPERLLNLDVPQGRWSLIFISNIVCTQWNYIPSL